MCDGLTLVQSVHCLQIFEGQGASYHSMPPKNRRGQAKAAALPAVPPSYEAVQDAPITALNEEHLVKVNDALDKVLAAFPGIH